MPHARSDSRSSTRPGSDPAADFAPLAEAVLRGESADPAPPLSPAEAADLPIALSTAGVGEAEALERLRRIVAATPSTSSPRFVNQLFAGRERVATAAELATVLLNNSMYTFKAAGPMVLVENEVLARLQARSGLAGGDGMFTPGGSLSNLAAMIVARNERFAGARDTGFDGRRAILYVSAEAHYSIRKNANMIGVGRDNVRPVAADAAGRMIPEELDRAIHADLDAGLTPFLVVATSGTTVIGAFDPIDAIADVTARHGLWLHVDGAFGGTALMHPRAKGLLAGLHRADSFTWDAHKAMGVPLTCSVALTREPGLMRTHFDETATYLFQQHADDDRLNPGTRSLQCGRRNDALKLWAQWQAIGDAGYADRVERQLALARHAAARLRDDDRFVLTLEPEWINICFEVRGKSSDRICESLDAAGVLKVGHAVVHERRVVRLVTANPAHTPGDIDAMLDAIAEAGARLPDGDNAV